MSTAEHPRHAAIFERLHHKDKSVFFHFGVYVFITGAGVVAYLNLPLQLLELIGPTLLMVFGLFGGLGSALCLLAIFPEVHWLERVGLLLILTSIVMYGVMLLALDGIPIGLFFSGALAMSLLRRLFEIRH